MNAPVVASRTSPKKQGLDAVGDADGAELGPNDSGHHETEGPTTITHAGMAEAAAAWTRKFPSHRWAVLT